MEWNDYVGFTNENMRTSAVVISGQPSGDMSFRKANIIGGEYDMCESYEFDRLSYPGVPLIAIIQGKFG